VRRNPLRDEIYYVMTSYVRKHPTARLNSLRDEIHCSKENHYAEKNHSVIKSIARQNPLHGEVLYTTRSKFCSAQLQMEMEQINDKLSFETNPWGCYMLSCHKNNMGANMHDFAKLLTNI
jgi:hypothetical protein